MTYIALILMKYCIKFIKFYKYLFSVFFYYEFLRIFCTGNVNPNYVNLWHILIILTFI